MRIGELMNGIDRTVAVTPSKSRSMDLETVKRICLDYTMLGLETTWEARGEGMEPLRFVYVSGAAAERDQRRRPGWMPEYSLMRVSFSFSLYLSLHHCLSFLGRDIDFLFLA